MAIVIGSHVTIYSHVQCHKAIFPPCLVFADFQFAAFTEFYIANPLNVIYSAVLTFLSHALFLVSSTIFEPIWALVSLFFIAKYSTIFTTFGRLFPALIFRFNSPNYFEVRHLYSLQHILHSVLEFLNNLWG
jgi:hypothetical protein